MATQLPPDVSAAIRKRGPSIDRYARKHYGISGTALLAKLVAGESGGRKDAVSSVGARGWTQFMPGTRDAVVQRFGIDPWRSPDEAVQAAVLHLTGRVTGNPGLGGYNPGDPSYPNYILNQKVRLSGGGTTVASTRRGSTVTTRTTGPQTDEKAAWRAALIAGAGGAPLATLGQRAESLIASGEFTTPGATVTTRGRVAAPRARTPGRGAGEIRELFYDPQGAWKNGRRLPAPIGGHSDHVHVAAKDSAVLLRLGRHAQAMGLRVGENKHFSGSTPRPGSHAPNSYHYTNHAIDVSGGAEAMARFARFVRREFGLG